MNNLLLDKVAVVTGSNRGIGKSILSKFAENKCEVFACARKRNSEFENYCSTLSQKYKTKIHAIFFDLNNTEEMREAVLKIKKSRNIGDYLKNFM